MIRAQNEKSAIMVSAISKTNAHTATGFVDTQDFDYCTIDVCATTTNDTTNNFSVLTLSEGPTTAAYTAIAAFTGDGASGFTIPAGLTAESQVIARLNVKLDTRQRYLYLECSPLTTQVIWANARLSYKDEAPTTAALLGVGVTATG